MTSPGPPRRRQRRRIDPPVRRRTDGAGRSEPHTAGLQTGADPAAPARTEAAGWGRSGMSGAGLSGENADRQPAGLPDVERRAFHHVRLTIAPRLRPPVQHLQVAQVVVAAHLYVGAPVAG